MGEVLFLIIGRRQIFSVAKISIIRWYSANLIEILTPLKHRARLWNDIFIAEFDLLVWCFELFPFMNCNFICFQIHDISFMFRGVFEKWQESGVTSINSSIFNLWSIFSATLCCSLGNVKSFKSYCNKLWSLT